ncbi:unnamed protein product [Amoebophrya sp. A120]|nr:unnamed protein product [Amoebophrya sp. A120]|eukprot:GSA120T00005421001.1
MAVGTQGSRVSVAAKKARLRESSENKSVDVALPGAGGSSVEEEKRKSSKAQRNIVPRKEEELKKDVGNLLRRTARKSAAQAQTRKSGASSSGSSPEKVPRALDEHQKRPTGNKQGSGTAPRSALAGKKDVAGSSTSPPPIKPARSSVGESLDMRATTKMARRIREVEEQLPQLLLDWRDTWRAREAAQASGREATTFELSILQRMLSDIQHTLAEAKNATVTLFNAEPLLQRIRKLDGKLVEYRRDELSYLAARAADEEEKEEMERRKSNEAQQAPVDEGVGAQEEAKPPETTGPKIPPESETEARPSRVNLRNLMGRTSGRGHRLSGRRKSRSPTDDTKTGAPAGGQEENANQKATSKRESSRISVEMRKLPSSTYSTRLRSTYVGSDRNKTAENALGLRATKQAEAVAGPQPASGEARSSSVMSVPMRQASVLERNFHSTYATSASVRFPSSYEPGLRETAASTAGSTSMSIEQRYPSDYTDPGYRPTSTMSSTMPSMREVPKSSVSEFRAMPTVHEEDATVFLPPDLSPRDALGNAREVLTQLTNEQNMANVLTSRGSSATTGTSAPRPSEASLQEAFVGLYKELRDDETRRIFQELKKAMQDREDTLLHMSSAEEARFASFVTASLDTLWESSSQAVTVRSSLEVIRTFALRQPLPAVPLRTEAAPLGFRDDFDAKNPDPATQGAPPSLQVLLDRFHAATRNLGKVGSTRDDEDKRGFAPSARNRLGVVAATRQSFSRLHRMWASAVQRSFGFFVRAFNCRLEGDDGGFLICTVPPSTKTAASDEKHPPSSQLLADKRDREQRVAEMRLLRAVNEVKGTLVPNFPLTENVLDALGSPHDPAAQESHLPSLRIRAATASLNRMLLLGLDSEKQLNVLDAIQAMQKVAEDSLPLLENKAEAVDAAQLLRNYLAFAEMCPLENPLLQLQYLTETRFRTLLESQLLLGTTEVEACKKFTKVPVFEKGENFQFVVEVLKQNSTGIQPTALGKPRKRDTRRGGEDSSTGIGVFSILEHEDQASDSGGAKRSSLSKFLPDDMDDLKKRRLEEDSETESEADELKADRDIDGHVLAKRIDDDFADLLDLNGQRLEGQKFAAHIMDRTGQARAELLHRLSPHLHKKREGSSGHQNVGRSYENNSSKPELLATYDDVDDILAVLLRCKEESQLFVRLKKIVHAKLDKVVEALAKKSSQGVKLDLLLVEVIHGLNFAAEYLHAVGSALSEDLAKVIAVLPLDLREYVEGAQRSADLFSFLDEYELQAPENANSLCLVLTRKLRAESGPLSPSASGGATSSVTGSKTSFIKDSTDGSPVDEVASRGGDGQVVGPSGAPALATAADNLLFYPDRSLLFREDERIERQLEEMAKRTLLTHAQVQDLARIARETKPFRAFPAGKSRPLWEDPAVLATVAGENLQKKMRMTFNSTNLFDVVDAADEARSLLPLSGVERENQELQETQAALEAELADLETEHQDFLSSVMSTRSRRSRRELKAMSPMLSSPGQASEQQADADGTTQPASDQKKRRRSSLIAYIDGVGPKISRDADADLFDTTLRDRVAAKLRKPGRESYYAALVREADEDGKHPAKSDKKFVAFLQRARPYLEERLEELAEEGAEIQDEMQDRAARLLRGLGKVKAERGRRSLEDDSEDAQAQLDLGLLFPDMYINEVDKNGRISPKLVRPPRTPTEKFRSLYQRLALVENVRSGRYYYRVAHLGAKRSLSDDAHYTRKKLFSELWQEAVQRMGRVRMKRFMTAGGSVYGPDAQMEHLYQDAVAWDVLGSREVLSKIKHDYVIKEDAKLLRLRSGRFGKNQPFLVKDVAESTATSPGEEGAEISNMSDDIELGGIYPDPFLAGDIVLLKRDLLHETDYERSSATESKRDTRTTTLAGTRSGDPYERLIDQILSSYPRHRPRLRVRDGIVSKRKLIRVDCVDSMTGGVLGEYRLDVSSIVHAQPEKELGMKGRIVYDVKMESPSSVAGPDVVSGSKVGRVSAAERRQSKASASSPSSGGDIQYLVPAEAERDMEELTTAGSSNLKSVASSRKSAVAKRKSLKSTESRATTTNMRTTRRSRTQTQQLAFAPQQRASATLPPGRERDGARRAASAADAATDSLQARRLRKSNKAKTTPLFFPEPVDDMDLPLRKSSMGSTSIDDSAEDFLQYDVKPLPGREVQVPRVLLRDVVVDSHDPRFDDFRMLRQLVQAGYQLGVRGTTSHTKRMKTGALGEDEAAFAEAFEMLKRGSSAWEDMDYLFTENLARHSLPGEHEKDRKSDHLLGGGGNGVDEDLFVSVWPVKRLLGNEGTFFSTSDFVAASTQDVARVLGKPGVRDFVVHRDFVVPEVYGPAFHATAQRDLLRVVPRDVVVATSFDKNMRVLRDLHKHPRSCILLVHVAGKDEMLDLEDDQADGLPSKRKKTEQIDMTRLSVSHFQEYENLGRAMATKAQENEVIEAERSQSSSGSEAEMKRESESLTYRLIPQAVVALFAEDEGGKMSMQGKPVMVPCNYLQPQSKYNRFDELSRTRVLAEGAVQERYDEELHEEYLPDLVLLKASAFMDNEQQLIEALTPQLQTLLALAAEGYVFRVLSYDPPAEAEAEDAEDETEDLGLLATVGVYTEDVLGSADAAGLSYVVPQEALAHLSPVFAVDRPCVAGDRVQLRQYEIGQSLGAGSEAAASRASSERATSETTVWDDFAAAEIVETKMYRGEICYCKDVYSADWIGGGTRAVLSFSGDAGGRTSRNSSNDEVELPRSWLEPLEKVDERRLLDKSTAVQLRDVLHGRRYRHRIKYLRKQLELGAALYAVPVGIDADVDLVPTGTTTNQSDLRGGSTRTTVVEVLGEDADEVSEEETDPTVAALEGKVAREEAKERDPRQDLIRIPSPLLRLQVWRRGLFVRELRIPAAYLSPVLLDSTTDDAGAGTTGHELEATSQAGALAEQVRSSRDSAAIHAVITHAAEGSIHPRNARSSLQPGEIVMLHSHTGLWPNQEAHLAAAAKEIKSGMCDLRFVESVSKHAALVALIGAHKEKDKYSVVKCVPVPKDAIAPVLEQFDLFYHSNTVPAMQNELVHVETLGAPRLDFAGKAILGGGLEDVGERSHRVLLPGDEVLVRPGFALADRLQARIQDGSSCVVAHIASGGHWYLLNTTLAPVSVAVDRGSALTTGFEPKDGEGELNSANEEEKKSNASSTLFPSTASESEQETTVDRALEEQSFFWLPARHVVVPATPFRLEGGIGKRVGVHDVCVPDAWTSAVRRVQTASSATLLEVGPALAQIGVLSRSSVYEVVSLPTVFVVLEEDLVMQVALPESAEEESEFAALQKLLAAFPHGQRVYLKTPLIGRGCASYTALMEALAAKNESTAKHELKIGTVSDHRVGVTIAGQHLHNKKEFLLPVSCLHLPRPLHARHDVQFEKKQRVSVKDVAGLEGDTEYVKVRDFVREVPRARVVVHSEDTRKGHAQVMLLDVDGLPLDRATIRSDLLEDFHKGMNEGTLASAPNLRKIVGATGTAPASASRKSKRKTKAADENQDSGKKVPCSIRPIVVYEGYRSVIDRLRALEARGDELLMPEREVKKKADRVIVLVHREAPPADESDTSALLANPLVCTEVVPRDCLLPHVETALVEERKPAAHSFFLPDTEVFLLGRAPELDPACQKLFDLYYAPGSDPSTKVKLLVRAQQGASVCVEPVLARLTKGALFQGESERERPFVLPAELLTQAQPIFDSVAAVAGEDDEHERYFAPLTEVLLRDVQVSAKEYPSVQLIRQHVEERGAILVIAQYLHRDDFVTDEMIAPDFSVADGCARIDVAVMLPEVWEGAQHAAKQENLQAAALDEYYSQFFQSSSEVAMISALPSVFLVPRQHFHFHPDAAGANSLPVAGEIVRIRSVVFPWASMTEAHYELVSSLRDFSTEKLLLHSVDTKLEEATVWVLDAQVPDQHPVTTVNLPLSALEPVITVENVAAYSYRESQLQQCLQYQAFLAERVDQTQESPTVMQSTAPAAAAPPQPAGHYSRRVTQNSARSRKRSSVARGSIVNGTLNLDPNRLLPVIEEELSGSILQAIAPEDKRLRPLTLERKTFSPLSRYYVAPGDTVLLTKQDTKNTQAEPLLQKVRQMSVNPNNRTRVLSYKPDLAEIAVSRTGIRRASVLDHQHAGFQQQTFHVPAVALVPHIDPDVKKCRIGDYVHLRDVFLGADEHVTVAEQFVQDEAAAQKNTETPHRHLIRLCQDVEEKDPLEKPTLACELVVAGIHGGVEYKTVQTTVHLPVQVLAPTLRTPEVGETGILRSLVVSRSADDAVRLLRSMLHSIIGSVLFVARKSAAYAEVCVFVGGKIVVPPSGRSAASRSSQRQSAAADRGSGSSVIGDFGNEKGFLVVPLHVLAAVEYKTMSELCAPLRPRLPKLEWLQEVFLTLPQKNFTEPRTDIARTLALLEKENSREPFVLRVLRLAKRSEFAKVNADDETEFAWDAEVVVSRRKGPAGEVLQSKKIIIPAERLDRAWISAIDVRPGEFVHIRACVFCEKTFPDVAEARQAVRKGAQLRVLTRMPVIEDDSVFLLRVVAGEQTFSLPHFSVIRWDSGAVDDADLSAPLRIRAIEVDDRWQKEAEKLWAIRSGADYGAFTVTVAPDWKTDKEIERIRTSGVKLKNFKMSTKKRHKNLATWKKDVEAGRLVRILIRRRLPVEADIVHLHRGQLAANLKGHPAIDAIDDARHKYAENSLEKLLQLPRAYLEEDNEAPTRLLHDIPSPETSSKAVVLHREVFLPVRRDTDEDDTAWSEFSVEETKELQAGENTDRTVRGTEESTAPEKALTKALLEKISPVTGDSGLQRTAVERGRALLEDVHMKHFDALRTADRGAAGRLRTKFRQNIQEEVERVESQLSGLKQLTNQIKGARAIAQMKREEQRKADAIQRGLVGRAYVPASDIYSVGAAFSVIESDEDDNRANEPKPSFLQSMGGQGASVRLSSIRSEGSTNAQQAPVFDLFQARHEAATGKRGGGPPDAFSTKGGFLGPMPVDDVLGSGISVNSFEPRIDPDRQSDINRRGESDVLSSSVASEAQLELDMNFLPKQNVFVADYRKVGRRELGKAKVPRTSIAERQRGNQDSRYVEFMRLIGDD